MPRQLDISNLEEVEDRPVEDKVTTAGNDSISVLEWVNQQRAEKGLRPIESLPKGLPGHPYYCPIAIAMDGDVSIRSAYGGTVELPESVQTFVKEYDEGAYPELVSEDLMRVLGNE